MATSEIFTKTMMQIHAQDTLHEWLQGYTDVLGDGKQRKITIESVDDDGITVRVQRAGVHGGYDRQDKRYRLTVEVQEVADG